MVVPEFVAVGQYYEDFAPVTDEAVTEMLDAAQRRRAATPAPVARPS